MTKLSFIIIFIICESYVKVNDDLFNRRYKLLPIYLPTQQLSIPTLVNRLFQSITLSRRNVHCDKKGNSSVCRFTFIGLIFSVKVVKRINCVKIDKLRKIVLQNYKEL